MTERERYRFPGSLPWRVGPEEIARFVAEATEPSPGGLVAASAMFVAYEEWCERSGYSPGTATAFGRALSRVLKKDKYGSVRYLDVALKKVGQ